MEAVLYEDAQTSNQIASQNLMRPVQKKKTKKFPNFKCKIAPVYDLCPSLFSFKRNRKTPHQWTYTNISDIETKGECKHDKNTPKER